MPAHRRPRSSVPTHDPAPAPAPAPSPSPSSPAAPSFRRDFAQAVYACVRQIPEGRVASYGRIAHLVGHPRHARMVGAALKALPRALALPFAADPAAPRPPRRRRGPDVRSDDDGDGGDEEDDDGAEASGSSTARRTSPSSSSRSPSPLPAPAPNPSFVPWHRVVSSSGLISPRGNPAATRRQAEWLEAEGVVVQRAHAQGGAAGGGGAGARGGGGGGEDGGGTEHGDAFGLGARVDGGGRVSMAQFAWDG